MRVAIGAVGRALGFADPALAADLPQVAPPIPASTAPATVVPFNWTGFFVGSDIGCGLFNEQITDNILRFVWNQISLQ